MWRLTYDPAPESGIRSTLQPSSIVYESESDSEDESYPPTSPSHSPEAPSPVEDPGDYSDAATLTPEPVPSEQIAGPSRANGKVHKQKPKKSGKGRISKSPAKESRTKSSTPLAGSSAGSSTTGSFYRDSDDLDKPDTAGSNLQTYILDDNGQKRYPCLRCDKKFGRSHDRKRHMEESTSCRGSQLGREQDGEVTPMWICSRCGDSFSRRDSLNRHMKNPDACKASKRLAS